MKKLQFCISLIYFFLFFFSISYLMPFPNHGLLSVEDVMQVSQLSINWMLI